MTALSRASLKTFFENGDIPQGSDFANLIDSCMNVVDTSAQSLASPLVVTELITPRVSAASANILGIVSAGSIATGAITASSITALSLFVSGNISAGSGSFTGDVSASTGTVYASALRTVTGTFGSVGIVSAAGTAQATAAPLAFVINRAKGVVDGSTTGFSIPANKTGLTQQIFNDTVSANLWPPTGGIINALGANAAFPMAASTNYFITHIAASAYAVK